MAERRSQLNGRRRHAFASWLLRGPCAAVAAMGAILWIYTLFGWARWAVPGWFDVDIQSGVAEIMTDPKTASGKRIMEELHTMPGVHAMLKPFGAPGFKWRPLSQMRWLPSVSHAPFWDGTPVWAIKLPLWIPAIGFGIPAVFAWRVFIRRKRRERDGLCTTCEYDRAGLAADAPCPECGTAPAARQQMANQQSNTRPE